LRRSQSIPVPAKQEPGISRFRVRVFNAHQSGNLPIDSPDGLFGLINFPEFTSRIRSKTARNPERVKANFVSGIMRIWVVQICAQDIYISSISENQKSWYLAAVLPRLEGRTRDRHETWGRMRWTQFVSPDERHRCGRPNRVVLTPRRWRQVSRNFPRGDGGKRARSPGRARYKPLKPLRREGRVNPANLW
jgi:hypothetical protein